MGYWYWRTLKKAWSVEEATSNKFDLPEKGHLSGLAFELYATNDEVLADVDNPFVLQQTTIRVVGNGNIEIVDLRGRQLAAINFWDTGFMPKDNLQTHDAAVQEQYAFIPFGRYLGDPKYGLILEKFVAGIEFEETNTFSTTRYQDGTEKYHIYGLFRKDPEPGLFDGGYLKKKQIKKKDTASEEEYDVKLPTRNKIRQIHMFSEPDLSAHVPETAVFTNLQYLWLSIKSKEEYIIDNFMTGHFARYIHQWAKRHAHTQVDCYVTDGTGQVFDSMIYERSNSQLTSRRAAASIGFEFTPTWLERTVRIGHVDMAGAAVTACMYLDSWGICYHGNVPLLMIPPEAGEEEWLDADVNKEVYVSFTEGASTGDIYIVLDELQKKYPPG